MAAVEGIFEKKFEGDEDRQRMMHLVHEFPADSLHVVDLPYRFSSWAFDEPENCRLWMDRQGTVVGWVVMQTPFWSIDYACHPDYADELHPQLLAWADQRAAKITSTPFGRPMWFINVFTDQTEYIRDLEEAGFASVADIGENSWTKVWMRHATEGQVSVPSPSTGFQIRPLAGKDEVGAYVNAHRAAFESNSMTSAWRARTLQHPAYVPDLDLAAVTSDGQLAAFCICWLHRSPLPGTPVSGQIEPLGVHPDFHGQGLGRAILSEGIRRLAAHGARDIYVETDNYRDAAFALYESVGFRVVRDVLVYRKDYA